MISCKWNFSHKNDFLYYFTYTYTWKTQNLLTYILNEQCKMGELVSIYKFISFWNMLNYLSNWLTEVLLSHRIEVLLFALCSDLLKTASSFGIDSRFLTSITSMLYPLIIALKYYWFRLINCQCCGGLRLQVSPPTYLKVRCQNSLLREYVTEDNSTAKRRKVQINHTVYFKLSFWPAWYV